MQHPDQRAKKTGNVLPLREVTSKNAPAPHPEAVVAGKIVTILKEMFRSWHSPKANSSR